MLPRHEAGGAVARAVLRELVLAAVGNGDADTVVVLVAKEGRERALRVRRDAIEHRLQRHVSALLFGLVEERQERTRAHVQAVVFARQATEILHAADVSLPTIIEQERTTGVAEAGVGIRSSAVGFE